jgi:hypothetical protein
LNDIAKDHPQIVIKTLAAWSKIVPQGYENEFAFMLNRALRTLIKNGDQGALKLMGIRSSKKGLKIEQFKVKTKKVKMNSNLVFSCVLKNSQNKREKYILDFVLYFFKFNGKLSSKVFKLKSGTIESRSQIKIDKSYSFKQITTRNYYPGPHKVSLKLNGFEGKPCVFTLVR